MLAAASGVGITQTMDLLAARELVDGRPVDGAARCTPCPGRRISIVHTPRGAAPGTRAGFLRVPARACMRRSRATARAAPATARERADPSALRASISGLMTAREAHIRSDGRPGLRPGARLLRADQAESRLAHHVHGHRGHVPGGARLPAGEARCSGARSASRSPHLRPPRSTTCWTRASTPRCRARACGPCRAARCPRPTRSPSPSCWARARC